LGEHSTIKSPLPCGKWSFLFSEHPSKQACVLDILGWIIFDDPFWGSIQQNQAIDLAVNGLFLFANILASKLAYWIF